LERVEYSSDLATFRENMRTAVAATDISRDSCEMVTLPDGTVFCPPLDVGNYERIVFDENGQSIYSNQTVSQNIDDTRWPLYPEVLRVAGAPSVVLPIPPWNER